jgi:hypothetical protein
MTDRSTQFDRADYAVRSSGPVPADKLDRIVEALSRCEAYLLPAAQAKLAAMFDRDTLLCLGFLVAVWGGLQFTPVGWLADALVTAAGLYSYAANVSELVEAGTHAALADRDEDLEKAAQEIAKALSDNVIDGLIAFIGGQAFKQLRRGVRGVRSRLLGRRFSAGGEKPLRLPGTKLVGLERSSVQLGEKKKQWEKAAEESAWIVALVGGVTFAAGTAIYVARRKRS